MSASYPGSLKSFSNKQNLIDVYDAQHINDLQDETVAVQTELGTDVAGDQTNLKTRLGYNIEDNGSFKHGTSFPGSPRAGDWFFRTDQNIAYVYTGSTWSPQSGVTAYTAGDYKILSNPTILLGTTSTSYIKASEIYISRSGTLRIKFWLVNSGGATGYGRIYRNGSAVGTERTTTSVVGTQFSEDISGWAAGDLLQIYHKTTGGNEVVSGAVELFEGAPSREEFDDVTYRTNKLYKYNLSASIPFTSMTGLGAIGDLATVDTGGASTTLYVKTGASTWTAK